LGGYRFVYNETEQKILHPIFFLTQLYNYMQFPVVCLLLSLYIDDKIHASGIAAGILTLANVPPLLISYFFGRRSLKDENIGRATQALLFTFHAR